MPAAPWYGRKPFAQRGQVVQQASTYIGGSDRRPRTQIACLVRNRVCRLARLQSGCMIKGFVDEVHR